MVFASDKDEHVTASGPNTVAETRNRTRMRGARGAQWHTGTGGGLPVGGTRIEFAVPTISKDCATRVAQRKHSTVSFYIL